MRMQLAEGLFYLVFLCQIFLVSFYLPRRLLGRMRDVTATYPPAEYPRLYPVSIEASGAAQRYFMGMNLFMLAVGLAVLVLSVVLPGLDLPGRDADPVLTLYSIAQFAPLVIASVWLSRYFARMRAKQTRSTRRAELRPRSLFDFVSPAAVGLAVAVYLGFVALVVYVRQFDYPWFGGYLNVAIITAVNLMFVALVAHTLHGRKTDPYQAHEDRMRVIGRSARLLIFVSVAMTAAVALFIGLRAAGLDPLVPIAMSVYLQLLAIMGVRQFGVIEDVDFEVYREEPVLT